MTELGAPVQRASSLAMELGVDEDEYRRQWKSRRPDVVLGRCSFQGALAQIVATLGSAPNENVLERLRSERLAQKAAVLHNVEAPLLATVAALRGRGLKLALVTNAFAEDVAGWASSPLQPFFDVTLFSYAANLVKPDPEIYLAACRQLDVPPEHALFIGDGIDEVAGARAAGLAALRALWFVSRWPQTTVTRDQPGLWSASEVVDAALAA